MMFRQNLLSFQNKYRKYFTFLDYGVFALLGVFIFCRPFPYTTSVTEICFYLSLGIALFLMIFNARAFIFKTPFTYPLMIFFLWSLLSIFWALNVENTVHDVRAHLLNHIIFYFLLINFFRSRKRIEMLAWGIVLSAAFFSVIGSVYYYVILGNSIQSYRFGTGLVNGATASTELATNFIGTLNITAILFCLYFFSQSTTLYRRIAISLCALVSFIAIILTQSRGTLAAFAISVGILIWIKNKKVFPIFLGFIIFILALTPLKNRMDSFTVMERFKINYISCEVLKDYPLQGIGFGMLTFKKSTNKESYINNLPEKYRPIELITPHSWLLDIAVRVGLIGLLLFLPILFIFVKLYWKTVRHAKDERIRRLGSMVAIAALSYFVMGLTEPLFYFKASSMIFYILLGMISILSILCDDSETIKDHDVGKEEMIGS